MSRIAIPLIPLTVEISDLRADPENARAHPEANIRAIRSSLEQFGQRKPIVVRASDHVVIAGNGTLEAARSLDWTSIAAVLVDDDAATSRAYALADNRTSEMSEWDPEKLDQSIALLLVEKGIDLAALGFSELDMKELHARETDPAEFSVDAETLVPHPSNYQEHPADQIAHLVESLKANGFYRNVVIARDGTILAGHGVVTAARAAGLSRIPVRRLDLDPKDPRALKILAGDNEISHLAERDDRALAEMLKVISEADSLLGTGYDEMMLANLVLVTRPESEIADINAAAEWVGMPEFAETTAPPRVVVSFRSEEDRKKFMDLLDATVINKKTKAVWSIWWPEKEKDALASMRFDDE